MNIEFKVIEDAAEKNELKNRFQTFFFDVYGKQLDDKTWEHHFVRSPYENSSLFIAVHEGAIVGSALMIPQKLMIDGRCIDYYLYTTSAILKAYRAYGVYAELLAMQREYCRINEKAFIFAFPNKLAYSVLKLFGGFKDVVKTNLVKTRLSQINPGGIENSLLIDKPMLDWRFEHNEYIFFLLEEHIIIAKDFEGDLYVLAVYNAESMEGMKFELQNVDKDQNIITLACFLKESSPVQQVGEVRATYFPIDRDLDKARIYINLLMSDVY